MATIPVAAPVAPKPVLRQVHGNGRGRRKPIGAVLPEGWTIGKLKKRKSRASARKRVRVGRR
jgi:hypothetical protein